MTPLKTAPVMATKEMDTRDLDALVAEKVMGFQDVRWGRGIEPPVLLYGGPCPFDVPFFSTRIADAWPIAERFEMSVVCSEDGWYAMVPQDIEHGSVRGTDYPYVMLICDEGTEPTPSETPSLAICLEALRAVGEATPND